MDAQVAVGGWTFHSPFTGVDEICETDTYIYYRSSGSLFRVDKETSELEIMDMSNYLNDSGMTGVYADPSGKNVIVAYESGSMDRVYDDGRIVNMSDIKDATITGSRKINDVAFGNDNIYVATDFGIVTFDKNKNEVRESMFTPKAVAIVFAIGNHIGVKIDGQMMFASQADKLTKFDKLKFLGGYTTKMGWRSIKSSGDRYALFSYQNGNNVNIYKFEIDVENNKIASWTIKDPNSSAVGKGFSTTIGVNSSGAYACNGKYVVCLDKDGNVTYENIPENIGNVVSYKYKGNTMWAGNDSGVSCYDITGEGTATQVSGPFSGSDLTIKGIHAMHVGASGKIYLYNLGEQMTFGISAPSPKRSKVVVIDNGKFRDVSGVDVKKEHSIGDSKTAPYFVNYNYRVFEDPTDPDAYYIGTNYEGAYRIKDGKQTHKYYAEYTPLGYQYGKWSANVSQPIVDKWGNLWLYSYEEKDENEPRFFVLPAEHRMDEVAPMEAWKSYIVKGYPEDKRDAFGYLCSNSNYIVFAPGRYNQGIIIFDTKGTASINDDTHHLFTSYINQDGKAVSFNHITAITDDARGRIWIGTDNGVFEISDIKKSTGNTLNVNQLKVPRNDGTNLADYLLDTQIVSSIAVDSSDRKWISTIGSGVYLVSETGNEIISHYTSDNSILPNNTIYAVACDPNSSKVYFGTSEGLVEYNSTSSPGSASYDDVYAYPNPVRPDYTGWITVAGLMDDSLVKISDTAGNVLHQGRSNGGMFTWDGCNASGERVKTGVYYVFASQNADGSASACVTKIMVIN